MEATYIARIALAGLLAAAIGLERQYHSKEAGLRTHFLVGLGAAMLMVVSKHAFADVAAGAGARYDPSRVASLAVSGVGFIGAGTIILRRNVVQGLTTAAGLWAASAVGLAVGAGMYLVGLAGTVLILAGLGILEWLPGRLAVTKARWVAMSMADAPGQITQLETALDRLGVKLERVDLRPGVAGPGRVMVDLALRLPAGIAWGEVEAALTRPAGATLWASSSQAAGAETGGHRTRG